MGPKNGCSIAAGHFGFDCHAEMFNKTVSAVLHAWQVLQIDGTNTEGWDGDRAAKSLRGSSGSSVMVKFARRSEQVPGVAGRPEQPPEIELKQVGPLYGGLELLCTLVSGMS